MDRIPLVRSCTTIALENFWNCVSIYYDRPHLINRKVVAVAPLLFCKISNSGDGIKHISDIFTREALLYESRKLPNPTTANIDFLRAAIEMNKDVIIEESMWDNFLYSTDGSFVSIRLLLGRHKNRKCLELVTLDKANNCVTFHAVQEQDTLIIAPQFPYHIQFTSDSNLVININNFDDAETSSAQWLADVLFEKLMKWAENSEDENVIKSLRLVSPYLYCTLYSEMKSKYASSLLKLWPEKTKTDPQKYVFEDLAIATYLICLWRQLEAVNIYFVDCGCGNGLLVYILNQEGYKGHGLDIRQRKIWEIYSGKADLRVETVTPSSTFPEATWIIGNHSDELTPWIPVMALRSSPKTNFFVLPCCSYDFGGQKYVRTNINVTQYKDYLNYIESISNRCGFNTLVDKLRIPSTRRICLVGTRNDCSDSALEGLKSGINEFINSRMELGFTPRNPQEKVRNCTRLDPNLISRIIGVVITNLLATSHNTNKTDGEKWNQGGNIALSDLIGTISSDDLKSLKNECGGLQTLLKNHRYIFKVQGGDVSLRPPLSIKDSTKYREKPCWFFKNHPDGCLFDSETCACKH